VALALTNQKIGFLVSLLVGAIVAGLILGIWRPKAKQD
jgi:PTS system fructose-specific IIC component